MFWSSTSFQQIPVTLQETRTSGAHALAGAGLGQSRQAPLSVPAGAAGQDQHEVLRKFFDGLLHSRGDRATTPATGRAPSGQSDQSGTTGQNGATVNGQATSESPVPSEPNGSGGGAE